MKFTGHERDPETGLDYMLARYYTSGSGRFLQVDPVDISFDFNNAKTRKEKQRIQQLLENPMIWNKYAYCYGNPIVSVDPDGRSVLIVVGVILLASATAVGIHELWKYAKRQNARHAQFRKAEDAQWDRVEWELHPNGKPPTGLIPGSQVDDYGQLAQDVYLQAVQDAGETALRIAKNTPGLSSTGPIPNVTKPLEVLAFINNLIAQLNELLDRSETEKAEKQAAEYRKRIQELEEAARQIENRNR